MSSKRELELLKLKQEEEIKVKSFLYIFLLF